MKSKERNIQYNQYPQNLTPFIKISCSLTASQEYHFSITDGSV